MRPGRRMFGRVGLTRGRRRAGHPVRPVCRGRDGAGHRRHLAGRGVARADGATRFAACGALQLAENSRENLGSVPGGNGTTALGAPARGRSHHSSPMNRFRQPARLIPLNRLPQADVERRNRAEAEFALCTADVQTPAWLSVGLGGIPNDPPREAGDAGNLDSQVGDGNLHAASEIHWVGLIVTFRRQNDAFGGILDVKKLAGGRTITPEDDLVAALVDSFHTLADQCRYDVGRFWLEVIARPVEVHWQEEDGVHTVLLTVGLTLN